MKLKAFFIILQKRKSEDASFKSKLKLKLSKMGGKKK